MIYMTSWGGSLAFHIVLFSSQPGVQPSSGHRVNLHTNVNVYLHLFDPLHQYGNHHARGTCAQTLSPPTLAYPSWQRAVAAAAVELSKAWFFL